ncbi:hypothetical protein DD599_27260, partial [Enterobacter cloacae complex sp. CH23B]
IVYLPAKEEKSPLNSEMELPNILPLNRLLFALSPGWCLRSPSTNILLLNQSVNGLLLKLILPFCGHLYFIRCKGMIGFGVRIIVCTPPFGDPGSGQLMTMRRNMDPSFRKRLISFDLSFEKNLSRLPILWCQARLSYNILFRQFRRFDSKLQQ